MIEPTGLTGFVETDLPKNIEDEVLIVQTVEAYISKLNPETIWANASGCPQLKLAILLKCREILIASNSYVRLDALPAFYVGSDFHTSLGERECSGNDKYARLTLNCCAAAVLNLPTIEIKDFRKNPRAADMAAPLRAHINKGKAAMRLMMWRRPAQGNRPETLEFANVGRKHEEEIIYSDPADAC